MSMKKISVYYLMVLSNFINCLVSKFNKNIVFLFIASCILFVLSNAFKDNK